MPQINLSAEMVKTLLEAIDDAVDYCNEIEDDNDVEDEWTEAAKERKGRYFEALDMLKELEKL